MEKTTIIAGHWESFGKWNNPYNSSPIKKWKKGNYQIIIDSRLEDITGNNLQNPLDQNKTEGENNSETHHYIKFKI